MVVSSTYRSDGHPQDDRYFRLDANSTSGPEFSNLECILFAALLLVQTAAGGGNALLSGILPIVLMFAIAYFLIFLPVQRQRKQQQTMLKGLQNGQTVLTSGGIIGTIIAVNSDDTLILRVKPDNLKIQVSQEFCYESGHARRRRR